MRLLAVAALSAVSFAALAAMVPAHAQSPRAQGPGVVYSNQTETITVIDQYGRRHTRVTVRPRSFLDPGTAQARPYEQHYMDYAVPAQTYSGEYFPSPTYQGDWKSSWSRMPFPTCYDAPGVCDRR
jgi:hypothetical protein